MTPAESASLFDVAEPVEGGDKALRVPAATPLPEWERCGRELAPGVFLGTSSWSFPGWRGLVYGGSASESVLSQQGLTAYARHPVLRAVGIDRSFYQPLDAGQYARYAHQVPEGFRFLVKAPAMVTDAALRAEGGAPSEDNPDFLDAALAARCFVQPALEGLGSRCGPLVFQLSPLPPAAVRPDARRAMVERIGAFFAALPKLVGDTDAVYALELRNRELLTPRLVQALREAGARLCLALHARMPEIARQADALRALDAPGHEADDWMLAGPLVVRWSLHAGLKYEGAKNRYAPFNRLVDPDPHTRAALASLARRAVRSGQPAYVIVNNKAEGSAPLSCVALAEAINA